MSRWFDNHGYATVHQSEDGAALFVGAHPLDVDDLRTITSFGITSVLNLCEEREYRSRERLTVERWYVRSSLWEVRMPTPDNEPIDAGTIDAAVTRILDWLGEGQRVFLHCRAGRERSPVIALAVIAQREGLTLPEALVALKGRKPTTQLPSDQLLEVHRWMLRAQATPASP